MNTFTSVAKEQQISHDPISISIRELIQLVFYAVYFLTFIISGHIIMLDITPYYRLGIVATLLVAPIWLLRARLKIDLMFWAFVGCIVTTIISSVYNDIGIARSLLFSRSFIYSYFAYYIVNLYIHSNNITRIMQLCITTALIQLPLVLAQQIFLYDLLPGNLRKNVNVLDFDFGTFVGDASLSFFLNLLIIFLLFDKQGRHIISYRWPILLWLTATIWVANSELGKLVSIIIWATYLVIHFYRPRVVIGCFFALAVLWGVAQSTGLYTTVTERFYKKLTHDALAVDDGRVNAYLNGKAYKGAALYYYLNSDILWIGDGPLAYSNPVDKSKVRGNFGHSFVFYSEIGIFGWLLSLGIFFFIAFDGLPRRFSTFRWTNFMVFVALCAMTLSVTVMSNISYIIISAIVAKSHMIPAVAKEVEESGSLYS